MKYIEIDGIRYKIDPNDPTKALEVNGEKVLYVEDKPKDPEPKDPTPEIDPKPVITDYDKLSDDDIEELAKTDPALARILSEKRRLQKEADAVAEQAEKDRKAALEKNGEFQQLAKEAEERATAASAKATESDSILEKYKNTVGNILDDMMSQIPEDKHSLIPKGSARKQIEYIKENAKFLGVSVIKKGSHVPKNETDPMLDDEGKLRKEFQDLLDKETLTQTETNRMTELSGLLKKFQTDRDKK